MKQTAAFVTSVLPPQEEKSNDETSSIPQQLVFSHPTKFKNMNSLKKMRLTCCIYPCGTNRFSVRKAVLRQCFIARWFRPACWRHRVSLYVRHDHSHSPNLSSADHCALDGGEEVARTLAGEMCLLRRLGSARISWWWIFHMVPVALFMQSQKGIQDLHDLGRGPSKGSDMLSKEQNHRQSY